MEPQTLERKTVEVRLSPFKVYAISFTVLILCLFGGVVYVSSKASPGNSTSLPAASPSEEIINYKPRDDSQGQVEGAATVSTPFGPKAPLKSLKPSPTATASATTSPSPTPTSTPAPTSNPTQTPTPTPTETPSPSPTPTPSPTESPTPSPTPNI